MDKNLLLYKKLIKNKGYEFTIQKRILLLEMINANTHLSVKQIYERIKDKNVGLATVYRSLKIFGELGIVKKINVDNINYYEIKIFSGKPLHVHFKCDKCNSIIDVDNLEQDLSYIKLNKKIEEKNDLEIYDVDIMLKGLCSKCKGG
ncbi:Fur family transcriptional regulator [Clostridium kluyveri]|uniref:Transcriptional repressor n=1 Tax=Clostridium kluyveri TaxID=1534 RepID=A0A1L5F4U3_CLOKL|nr:transcriptional repressor [Clostridium kluyveri]APM38013.1 transcriptional repressor [Clostridium kluyveri]UZQ51977.1 transcriptional repressor [Clostridium kluyveri]